MSKAELQLFPYQIHGANFLSANPSALLADEMGLGKTPQALMALGQLFEKHPNSKALVVCPASLKLNWKFEAERWLGEKARVCIVPALERANANIFIINYDILEKCLEALLAIDFAVVILDEAHYIKNLKAKRTKAVFKLKAKRKWLLTGTPILNRPIELYPLVKYIKPDLFKTKFAFGMRYCAGFKSKWGWDFSGASNLDELSSILYKSVMLRRLKKDVLQELPDKQEQLLCLGEGSQQFLISEEVDDIEAFSKKVHANKFLFEEISARRHKEAEEKAPHVIEYLETLTEKAVVFCTHKVMVEALKAQFGDRAVVVTGDTPSDQRFIAQNDFQNKPEIQFFIGNIKAAGVGLTLTAASHVVFAELDWVPGNIAQASDRCHRIGQKDSVLVTFLYLENSLDSRLLKSIVSKQKVLFQTLERKEENMSKMKVIEQEIALIEKSIAVIKALFETEKPVLHDCPPAPATKEPVKEVSVDEARAALKAYIDKNGRDAAIEILAAFNVKTLTELPAEKRGALIEKVGV